MATPKLHSFDILRGDTRRLTYAVKDQQVTPAVVDITGADIQWVFVNQDPSSKLGEPQPQGEALVTKTTAGGGVVITNGPQGEFYVKLDSVDTNTRLAPADYYHEVQMDLSSEITSLVYGVITLKRDRIAPGP